eukprot:COSAG02_NODE_803_length_17021_cov_18.597270_3_plen_105_part_00
MPKRFGGSIITVNNRTNQPKLVRFWSRTLVPAGVSASGILTEKFVLSVEHESAGEQDYSADRKLACFRNTGEAQGSAVRLHLQMLFNFICVSHAARCHISLKTR